MVSKAYIFQAFTCVSSTKRLIPFLDRVVCKCGFCKTKKQALREWERHTGSKFKNWRTSVQVKGSMLSLEKWMLQLAEYHANAEVSVKPKKPSLKERKQRLLNFLQEKYEPVCAKWIQNDVLYVDGLKIGITTKLSFATDAK